MLEYYLVNGQKVSNAQIKLCIKDMAWLYGCSLFETMLVIKGQPVFVDHHLMRLEKSASSLGIKLSRSYDELAIMCSQAVTHSGIHAGVLRLTVTAGDGGDEAGSTIISVREGVPYRAEQYAKGAALLTLDFPRNEKSPLVKHKTANYLENLLGRQKARRLGYDEGLFFNTKGMVAEGTVSNIFIVQNGLLLTPPVDAGLLPGTVRRLVIEHAPKVGYKCMEAHLNRAHIINADECFLTNALMGIMSVVNLDGYLLGKGEPGKPGSVVKKISGMYHALVLEKGLG